MMLMVIVMLDERRRRAQGSQGVAGDMVRERPQGVVRSDFVVRHQHGHHVAGRTVEDALADDRQRQMDNPVLP